MQVDISKSKQNSAAEHTAQKKLVVHPNCQLFARKLGQCDREELIRDLPAKIKQFYPIINPDDDATMYDEVYTMLNEALLKKSHKFRVFYFLNLFLSSSKVPAYIIAAYVKRLSRLSLKAKNRSLVCILKLVGNVFMRHPILIILRDRVDTIATDIGTNSDKCTIRQWLDLDPFNPYECNLKSSNALESCIWELMPHRFHEHPRVADAAQYLGETKVPEMEF